MQSAHFGGRRREFAHHFNKRIPSASIIIVLNRTVHRSCQGIWRFVGCGGRQMPLESQFKHCCGQSRRYIRGPKRRERFIMRQHKMGTRTVVGEHVGPGGRRRGQNNRHMGGCPYGVSRVVEGGAATFEYIRPGQNWRCPTAARLRRPGPGRDLARDLELPQEGTPETDSWRSLGHSPLATGQKS